MTWEEIMRRVLPPINGVSPHITSEFGSTNRPVGSTNPHRGVDFNYIGGRYAALNRSNPVLHSPVAGVVVNSGEGSAGRIAIRDANGFVHEILHTHTQSVKKGHLVGVGTPIGTMGNTGVNPGDPKKGDPHVHYQLKDRAGNVMNPTGFWNNLDPGKDDPGQPAFLDQSRHAREILSGLGEKSSRNGGSPPNRPGNRFFNPFNPVPAAGFVPRLDAPAASDDSTNFADRFGNWAAKPFGGLGNVGAPAPQPAPNPGRRSDIPDGVTPAFAQATPAVWPWLSADASGLGGVLKYAVPAGTGAELPLADPNALDFPPPGNASDDNVPERRLARRVVNLSAPASPGAPPLAPGFVDAAGGSGNGAAAQPAPPPLAPNQAASPPLLGIFSGQPMPDWPVPPPTFQSKDQASPEDNELWQRWRAFIGD